MELCEWWMARFDKKKEDKDMNVRRRVRCERGERQTIRWQCWRKQSKLAFAIASNTTVQTLPRYNYLSRCLTRHVMADTIVRRPLSFHHVTS